MASSYIQQNGSTEVVSTNPVITLTNLPSVGNTMILNYEGAGGNNATAITDSVNTWTLAQSQANGTNSVGSQWYCQVANAYSPGATITITAAGASNAKQAEVDEFSGLSQPVTLDGTDSKATTSSVTTLSTTVGLTTTQSSDLIVGMIGPGTNQSGGAGSFTPPTSFTPISEGILFYRLQVAYWYPGVTLSSQTFTWAWTNSGNASMIFVAYKVVSTPSTSTGSLMMLGVGN